MIQAAVASIPTDGQRTHLTAPQRRELRALVAERLWTQRQRAELAAAALDEFTSSDSPYEREEARDTLQSLLDGIREHEDALARLDSETYGQCNVCARPIPFERLEAIPEVRHCVGCVRLG